jgi:hypothetical protein
MGSEKSPDGTWGRGHRSTSGVDAYPIDALHTALAAKQGWNDGGGAARAHGSGEVAMRRALPL